MNSKIEKMHYQTFESIKRIDADGNEFWYARALAKILDYAEYRNFMPVIEKAKIACEKSGYEISDHFVEANEEIIHGKGATQSYESYKLSRYACYLVDYHPCESMSSLRRQGSMPQIERNKF